MRTQQQFSECPNCHGKNIQVVGEDAWFCLDCDWDNLPVVTKKTDALISALRYGDLQTRREAAQMLINMGNTEQHLAMSDDLGPLLEALDDVDDDVRYFATVALGKLGDTRALTKLKRVAQIDSAVLVREGAKTAIERIEGRLGRLAV